jgi:hypothetical protein
MAVGHILLVSWIVVMVICQLIFFGIMLYAMYRAIIQSILRLKDDFSAKNLIREVLNTIGEG